MDFRFYLTSGDGDDYPGCYLYAFGWQKKLPDWIFRPSQEVKNFTCLSKEEMEVRIARGFSNSYFEYSERRIGFSLFSDGSTQEVFCQIWLGGRYTCDSATNQTISFFLPWTMSRHVRHSLYDLDGKLFSFDTGTWEEWERWRSEVPKATFAFQDFDGEVIEAETYISEREWRKGEKPFRWLSWFHPPLVRRSLQMEFSKEVGDRKGSWKGGITGTGIEMQEGELHQAAFRRYCDRNGLVFLGTGQSSETKA